MTNSGCYLHKHKVLTVILRVEGTVLGGWQCWVGLCVTEPGPPKCLSLLFPLSAKKPLSEECSGHFFPPPTRICWLKLAPPVSANGVLVLVRALTTVSHWCLSLSSLFQNPSFSCSTVEVTLLLLGKLWAKDSCGTCQLFYSFCHLVSFRHSTDTQMQSKVIYLPVLLPCVARGLALHTKLLRLKSEVWTSWGHLIPCRRFPGETELDWYPRDLAVWSSASPRTCLGLTHFPHL